MIRADALHAKQRIGRDAEIADLRARLREAEETLAALRNGKADALLGNAGIYLLGRPMRPAEPDAGKDAPNANSAEALRRAAIVVEHTQEGVMVTDLDSTIRYTNPAFTRITGFTAADAVGAKPSLLRSHRHDRHFYGEMWRTLNDTGQWRGEVWNRRRNGEPYLQWTRIDRIPAQHGEAAGYISVFTDVTDIWRRNERTAHLANHDALTDLPNRALLLDRLGHALEVADRRGGGLGVLFVDLDGFKAVNDKLGHLRGDHVLQEVAHRLKDCVRCSDTVARLGGDEFVVLMEGIVTQDECAVLAAKLLATLSWRTTGGLAVGASIGIAVYPQDGLDTASLLDCADRALYAAKAAGKGAFRFARGIGV